MDLEHKAIERLKTAAEMSESIYGKPLVITYSGGKDSDVCLELAKHSGINFEIQHSHTTADAPQTVYHVRKKFNNLECDGIHCEINYPVYKGERISMWTLIPLKLMPPTRTMRYCCEVLKEQGGKDRFITTGVRWSESVKRKNNRGIYEAGRNIILNNDNDDKRTLFESCSVKSKRVCNPIIDWDDKDVWMFLKEYKVETNPLYKCGFNRIGCIGCPMSNKNGRYKQFSMFPTYKTSYINSFDRLLEYRKTNGYESNEQWGRTGEEMFHWWMEDGVLPNQMSIEGVIE